MQIITDCRTNFNGNRMFDMAKRTEKYYETLSKELMEGDAVVITKAKKSIVRKAKKIRTKKYYDTLFREIDNKIKQGGDRNIYSLISNEPAVTFMNPRTGAKTVIYSKKSKNIVTVYDSNKDIFVKDSIPRNTELYIAKDGNLYKTERTATRGECGILKNCSENSDKFIWTGNEWQKVNE